MQEAPVLRPLSVGDIIDRIFRLFRANVVLFITIAVLPSLIVEVIQRVSGLSQTFDLNDFTAAFSTPGSPTPLDRQISQVDPAVATIAGLVSVAVSLIQAAALTAAVGQRYLGRPITAREALERGLRAMPRLLVIAVVVIVVFAIVAGIVVFALYLVLLTSPAARVIAIIAGFVGFLFVLPWLFLSLALITPTVVLEGLGPIAAIRRSFHLMDRSRLRTLGLYFLIGIISSILGAVFGILFLASFVTEPTARPVLQALATIASGSVSGPLLYGALVLLYYDLRVRKEAFDLQLAAEALPREG